MALARLQNAWHAWRGYDPVTEGPSSDPKFDLDADHHGNATVSRVILALCAVGVALSTYMIYEFYHPLTKAFCDVTEGVSCTKLVLLGWASLFGAPISVLGLFWFLTLVAAELFAIWSQRKTFALAVLIWTVLGVLFVFYLVSVEVFVGTICPACTVVHVILVVLLGLATLQFARRNGCPALKGVPALAWRQLPALLWKEAPFLIVAGFLNVLPFAAYNLVPNLLGLGDGWTADMKVELAQCLKREHVVIYTKAGCPYCIWQKSLFGSALAYLDVKCCTDPENQQHCADINIIGYPTWVMYSEHGKEIKRNLGELPLDRLDVWGECLVRRPLKLDRKGHKVRTASIFTSEKLGVF